MNNSDSKPAGRHMLETKKIIPPPIKSSHGDWNQLKASAKTFSHAISHMENECAKMFIFQKFIFIEFPEKPQRSHFAPLKIYVIYA